MARHAVAYAAGGVAVLLALAAPVLGLRLGLPDQGSMPESRTERRAYDLIAEGFGPGATGPLVLALDTTSPRVVDDVTRAIEEDPGIASVQPLPTRDDAEASVLIAQPTTSPQDAATQATIRRLRGEVLPSVLVPVKAALLNLLSVAAAYGVLVMVFQWGWGASLIGLESTVPIISFIPLFMFAILFGLSMDYEVFLLSRVREEYLRTGDPDAAVVHGVAVTARTISSAAAIMVAVFGGFVLGEDPILKMLGLGLATAVLVDATLVRLVLVPAAMRLLGPAAWWLPGWLDRWLPRLDVEPGPAPATATAPATAPASAPGLG